MEGVIIQVFLKTVRMKFLDNTTCTVKKEDLVFENEYPDKSQNAFITEDNCTEDVEVYNGDNDVEENNITDNVIEDVEHSIATDNVLMVNKKDEKYYLCVNDKKVFVGVLDGNPDLVHGNKVKEGNGRFLIKSVLLRTALSWKNYNPDIHCVNTWIIWNLANTTKLKVKSLPVSEASCATNTEGGIEKERGRKRSRNPEESRNNKKKKLRNRGLSYSPVQIKGKPRKERVGHRLMKDGCANTCRLKCCTKVKGEERQKLFDEFWERGDLIKQRQYVAVNVVKNIKNRSRQRNQDTVKNRMHSLVYTLNGIQVCKTMFLNTYSVSEKFVRNALAKTDENG